MEREHTKLPIFELARFHAKLGSDAEVVLTYEKVVADLFKQLCYGTLLTVYQDRTEIVLEHLLSIAVVFVQAVVQR
jgi:hypothetical protein